MLDQLISLLGQQGNLLVLLLVFASVALFTVVVANLTASWFGVRRRAVAGGAELATAPGGPAVADLVETAKGGKAALDSLLPTNEMEKSELRRFLNTAGYYGAGAPATYQLIRIVTALGFGMVTALNIGRLFPDLTFMPLIGGSLLMTFLGYMLPRTIVSMRRDSLYEEHRQGFPDFLDLLVICIEAGIGIDSAIDRVSKDLEDSFPSLARNLAFMNLEMRAGRSTRDALDNLAARLGIDEARSFATLIQQSEELGSSLVDSLHVYSDEMRAKRLARAEEKAHALPVKLVIPLGLFIFPVILGVTLLPVALRIWEVLGS
jgi:tight adherence protein C